MVRSAKSSWFSRREWLVSAGLGVSPAVWSPWATAQARDTTVCVLYRRAGSESVVRTHDAAVSALQSIEDELAVGGTTVIQPNPDTYARIADAPGVIVSFSRDAGYALQVEVLPRLRPYSDTNMQWGAVLVNARLTLGVQILGTFSQHSQLLFKADQPPERAWEVAASKAGRALARQVAQRIRDRSMTGAVLNDPAPPVYISAPLSLSASLRKRWALLIGVSDFSEVRRLNHVKAPDLPAVRNDMALMRKTLLELGYSDDAVISLVDQRATMAAVRQALNQLATRTQPEDQVFVLLGSHGVPRDGSWTNFGAPLFFDTQLNAPDLLDFERFKDALRNLPANRLIWANDTCHSGGALVTEQVVSISSRNLEVQAVAGFDHQLAIRSIPKHVAVLAASRESQYAFNDSANQHGIFTKQLAEGLRSTRGQTSVEALYHSHLEDRIPALARELPCRAEYERCPRQQQPGFGFSGRGNQLSLA